MIKQVKGIRNKIGYLSQLIDEPDTTISYEINKYHDSLLLANAWLGVSLENLYANYNHDPADKEYVKRSEDCLALTIEIGDKEGLFDGKDSFKKVEWLISEISKVNTTLHNISLDSALAFQLLIHSPGDSNMRMYRHNALQHLSEARFWLDFYLIKTKK